MYLGVNGWPGTWAVPRYSRGFRYRLGRIDVVVVIQWPIWKGHGKAALSGLLPFQTHLIMLVSVSTEAWARLQIAWAAMSKPLIVKLEKRMGTFFRRWLFKCSLFPPELPSHFCSGSTQNVWGTLSLSLGASSITASAGTALPCYSVPRVLKWNCHCWVVQRNRVWHEAPAATENRLLLHLFFQRRESLKARCRHALS